MWFFPNAKWALLDNFSDFRVQNIFKRAYLRYWQKNYKKCVKEQKQTQINTSENVPYRL